MAYDSKIVKRALLKLERNKADHARELERRKRDCYAEIPELETIDCELRETMSKAMLAAVEGGGDIDEAFCQLKAENLDLQERRAALLASAGYSYDYYDDQPMCKSCSDSGYFGGGMCVCLKSICAAEQTKELSALLKLGSESFDGFNLDFYSDTPERPGAYSDKFRMRMNYDTAVFYARNFGAASHSLLFSGKPGLGKTYLAACIARDVAERGFSVVYDTSISILDAFERVKFRNETNETAATITESCLGCDLLIFDDLGTEMLTQFTQSAIYSLVNTRLLKGKKTIITTNLTENEIRERYSAATASRLLGEYSVLKFLGSDIRVQKKNMQLG